LLPNEAQDNETGISHFKSHALSGESVQLEGTQRISIRDKIFREAITNLLIHREFSNPFPAKMVIERERVYIENGNKPHGNGIIDPEDFSPYPKNPKIAKFFKEIGWVDELGSGVRNIYKYNKIYSGADPEFIEGDVFKTIIPLTEQATTQATNQDTNQATNQATNQDTSLNDEKIKSLLEFCKVPRTREEMQKFMKFNNRGYFRTKILNPLVNGGLIKMTLPEKPTSKNQKYFSDR